jgi:nitrile hydratase accessory protein
VISQPPAAPTETEAAPGIPRDEGGPVFKEPWEAQAFALAAALTRQGCFSAGEWAAALGRAIRRAQAAGDPDTGDTYYHHWLAALEQMVVEKGLTTPAALTACRDAWEAAARRTPHGKPIELPEGRSRTS